MTIIAPVLRAVSVLSAVGTLACVSDFSPDPYKGDQNVSPDQDASAGLPRTDGALPSSGTDGAPPAGPVDAGGARDDAAPSQRDGAASSGGAGCDLSGRWIVSERATSVAAEARQVSVTWHYVELTQTGDTLTVGKSLLCGGSTKSPPGELVSVNMDDSPSWPAYQEKVNYTGRTGTAAAGGSGCDVRFAQGVLVRGASVATYSDPSVALPTAQQKADGATPGWEDWDGDGNPGITMNVTTLGVKLYTSLRTIITSCSGSVAAGASNFKLDDFVWALKRVVYGTNSDPITAQLVTAEASRSPKPGDNFVEFGRLSADQAVGSDAEICTAVRALKDTLNPAANPKP